VAEDDDDPLSGRVPTTVWAQTKLAGLASPAGKQAFSQLATGYWYPIFCFVRRKFGANGAEDLTQGFFVDLTENNDLAQVDPAKGRFRSCLLKRVQNFVIDQKRVDGALKRGGGKRPISFDVELAEESFRFRVHDDATPEDAYAQSVDPFPLPRTDLVALVGAQELVGAFVVGAVEHVLVDVEFEGVANPFLSRDDIVEVVVLDVVLTPQLCSDLACHVGFDPQLSDVESVVQKTATSLAQTPSPDEDGLVDATGAIRAVVAACRARKCAQEREAQQTAHEWF
jgi:hypothetical protein